MTPRSTRHWINIHLTRDPIKIDLRPGAGGDAANAEGRGRSTRRRTDRNRRGAGPFKDPRRGAAAMGDARRGEGELSLFKFTSLSSHYFYFVLWIVSLHGLHVTNVPRASLLAVRVDDRPRRRRQWSWRPDRPGRDRRNEGESAAVAMPAGPTKVVTRLAIAPQERGERRVRGDVTMSAGPTKGAVRPAIAA